MKTVIKNIMTFYLYKKLIQFTLTNMFRFDDKKLKSKGQALKVQTSEKCNHYESIPLQNLSSAHHSIPLWHMGSKMLVDIVGR